VGVIGLQWDGFKQYINDFFAAKHLETPETRAAAGTALLSKIRGWLDMLPPAALQPRANGKVNMLRVTADGGADVSTGASSGAGPSSGTAAGGAGAGGAAAGGDGPGDAAAGGDGAGDAAAGSDPIWGSGPEAAVMAAMTSCYARLFGKDKTASAIAAAFRDLDDAAIDAVAAEALATADTAAADGVTESAALCGLAGTLKDFAQGLAPTVFGMRIAQRYKPDNKELPADCVKYCIKVVHWLQVSCILQSVKLILWHLMHTPAVLQASNEQLSHADLHPCYDARHW
jgi:hypothetical protein